MIKDDEIRSGLRRSGVPELVFGTTLVKEGAPALRELVTKGTLVRQASSRGLFLHPSKRQEVAHTRKLFYLVAKELYLSGITVSCLPLSRLVEFLNSDEMVPESDRVERVRMVFLLDFYEEGAGFPFTAADAAKLRTWVRRRFEAGNAVSFLSDTPIDRCTPWWPQSFIGFISDNVIIHSA